MEIDLLNINIFDFVDVKQNTNNLKHNYFINIIIHKNFTKLNIYWIKTKLHKWSSWLTKSTNYGPYDEFFTQMVPVVSKSCKNGPFD